MLLLIQDAQRSDIYRRHHRVGLDLERKETVKATCRTKENAAVAGFISAIGLELFADESVVKREPLYTFVGNILHDTTLGGEP